MTSRAIDINQARSSKFFAILPAFAMLVANLLLIGGAILISISPSAAQIPILFVGFLIGHIVLCVRSFRLRDRGLIFLNISMATLDLYAIGIRL